MKFIPYSKPDITNKEVSEVLKTLKSGWITTGPNCDLFENDFKKYLNTRRHCISVSSNTAGLHLSLESFGIGENDEVITTVHTFTATASVITFLKAKPVFVDIDPETYCIDPEQIEKSITKNTKAIIVVHFGGYPCNMNEILKLAKRYKLKVIEDAAHSLPTNYNGQIIGSLKTDATIFSFYANKTMTTGEGGMVVVNNKKIADRIKLMRLHGISRFSYNRFNTKVAKWKYDVLLPGFKYNLTDIAASLGRVQLNRLNEFHDKRCKLAELYFNELGDIKIGLPPIPDNNIKNHSWHLFIIQVNPLNRDAIIEDLFKNKIGTSVHYIPLHLHSYWKTNHKLKIKNFKNSQNIYKKTISLPLYTKLSIKDCFKITKSLKRILKKYEKSV